MAKDLHRLLERKDDARYGLRVVSRGDVVKMVEWARRLLESARKAVESV